MAKFDAIDDDVGKPGKPPKPRRFPWRLWLWALVMTAAAGAGGYFTWYFKGEADAAITAQRDTLAKAADEQKRAVDATADACTKDKAKTDAAALKLQQELETLQKNSNVTAEQLKIAKEQIDQYNAQIEQKKKIEDQFAKMIDAGSLKVTSRRGGLVLSLPAEVLFPSGVADLSEEGKVKVHEIGFTLKNEKAFKERRFLVVGHSDSQPLKGSVYKDNLELSAARALTVTRFLVQAGMDPKSLLPSGAGDHDPIVANATTPKDLARNRRIEIALLPEIPTQLGDGKAGPAPAPATGPADKPAEKPAEKKAEPAKPPG